VRLLTFAWEEGPEVLTNNLSDHRFNGVEDKISGSHLVDLVAVPLAQLRICKRLVHPEAREEGWTSTDVINSACAGPRRSLLQGCEEGRDAPRAKLSIECKQSDKDSLRSITDEGCVISELLERGTSDCWRKGRLYLNDCTNGIRDDEDQVSILVQQGICCVVQ
jgi:hypothetical protein